MKGVQAPYEPLSLHKNSSDDDDDDDSRVSGSTIPTMEADGDELTERHRRNPQRAIELQAVLATLGLASRVFETTIHRKRRFIREGTRLLVDDIRFTGHSFKYFSVEHPLRHTVIRIVTNRRFRFWMALLYVVSAALILQRSDPARRYPDETWSASEYAGVVMDRILIIIFAVDLMLAFIAHGVLKCMRQVWYMIDVLLLTASIAQELTNGDDNQTVSLVLFTVSSLRPMRVVSRMKSMLKLIDILVASSEKLFQVAQLVVGMCTLFSIAAVIMFRNASHTRCFNPSSQSWGGSCNADNSDTTDFLYCPCPEGTVCKDSAPNLGPYYSYDHIGFALLVLVQIGTLDNWTPLAVDMMGSMTPAVGVFFVIATFLLAFWVTNQVTAVIFDAFSTMFQQERSINTARKKRLTEEKKLLQMQQQQHQFPIPGKSNSKPVRGSAPHASRAIVRMKQQIADDAIKSMTNGIQSVNVRDYVTSAARDQADKLRSQQAKSRTADFLLDDTNTIDGLSMSRSYRFLELEASLPQAQFEVLQMVKERQFRSDEEKFLVLNHFHSMSDAARTRCLRLLQWREEGTSHSAPVGDGGQTDGLAEPLLRIRGEGQPHMQELFVSSSDEDLWEEMSRVDSDDGNEFPLTEGGKGVKETTPSQKKKRAEETIEERLHRLQEEHRMLWSVASPVLGSIRDARRDWRRRRKTDGPVSAPPEVGATADDKAEIRSTGAGEDLNSMAFGDESTEANHRLHHTLSSSSTASTASSASTSTSSSSSRSSSSSSNDTLSRALRAHTRIERLNAQEGQRATEHRSTPVRTASKTVLRAPSWKTAKSLDEVLGVGVRSEEGQSEFSVSQTAVVIAPTPHRAQAASLGHQGRVGSRGRSLMDRTMSIEEHRIANKLLKQIIREYNESGEAFREADSRRQQRRTLWERLQLQWAQWQPLVWCYHLIMHPWYDVALMAMTLLNCFALLFQHHNSPKGLEIFLDALSGMVDVLLVLDVAMRMALTSVVGYLLLVKRNMYNVVEFTVSCACLVDLVVACTDVLPTFRAFRVLRLMKYMRRFRLLRELLLMLRTSIRYLMNLLLLQIFVWLVFTFSGRQLFGTTFSSTSYLQPCSLYNDDPIQCNFGAPNCVFVNASEWMTWNTTTIMEIKSASKRSTQSPSFTVSPSLVKPPLRSISTNALSVSMSKSDEYSESRSLWDTGPIPSTALPHNQSNTSAPNSTTTTAPATVWPPVSPQPPAVHRWNRTCRQFQGWDEVSAQNRFSFETLTFAFISVFDIVTRDNWTTIQYLFMQQAGSYSFIFFVAAMIVCGYLILSLLVAILLVNFEQRDIVKLRVPDSADQRETFHQEVLLAHSRGAPLHTAASRMLSSIAEQAHANADDEKRNDAKAPSTQLEVKNEAIIPQVATQRTPPPPRSSTSSPSLRNDSVSGHATTPSPLQLSASVAQHDNSRIQRIHSTLAGVARGLVAYMAEKLTISEATRQKGWYRKLSQWKDVVLLISDATHYPIPVIEGKSLKLFTPTNPLRRFAVSLIRGETILHVEKFIFFATFLHCVVSTASTKMIETPWLLTMFKALDWILMLLSVVEMLLRFIASGLYQGQHAYWHACGVSGRIDAVVVCVSVLANLIPVAVGGFTADAYRGTAIGFALKGVRPSRIISRSSSMRNVVIAVWQTVPDMASVFGLSAVLFVMFALGCVEVFRGRLRRCSDGSDRSESECVGTWIATPAAGTNTYFPDGVESIILQRRWENPDILNFDNAYSAVVTLFITSMVSTWSQPMFAMIDAPDAAGGSPVRNYSPKTAGFLISWVIISNNFLINIFVGAIVDRFSKLKDQLQGNTFVSAEQSEIARIKKSLVTRNAKKVLRVPATPFIDRRLNIIVFSLVTHVWFQRCIKACLILNLLAQMSLHYGQGDSFELLQMWVNVFVSIAFIIEGVLKVCVGGFGTYFSVKFHFVEAIVAGEAVMELAYFGLGHRSPPTTVQVLRLIRVVRLVRDAKGLRRILHTGYKALPAMGNIGVVLIAVLYTFAMIGIGLFEDLAYGLDSTSNTQFSPMFSLRTAPKAMFLLYTVSTLDNLVQLLDMTGVQPPGCSSAMANCGQPIVSSLYFLVFVVSVTLVMLNLFMAVVLENFSDAVLLPQYLEERQKDMESFRKAWSKFDDGRNVIRAANMVPLLRTLPGPQQRFALLKQTRDEAADDDSAHSLESDDMRVYAETQTIGLGGCPLGSVIPTVKGLRIVVTMPKEEILYLDAVSAIGEKIYHAELVDASVRSAYERVMQDAEETKIPFVRWYSTLRFQKLFRARLFGQRQHQTVLQMRQSVDDSTNVDNAINSTGAHASYFTPKPPPFLPPAHIASGSPLWNDVLDPIIVAFVRQNFRSAWTTDATSINAKMRKITLTKRATAADREGEGETAAEEDEIRQHRQNILHEVERRQVKTLADTLKERQVEVEEAPEIIEDTSWMTIIQPLSSREDDIASLHRHDRPDSASMAHGLHGWVGRRRVDPETGAVSHVPALSELILSNRKEIIFQLFADAFRQKKPLDMEQLRELASWTTSDLKAKLVDRNIAPVTVWTAMQTRWRAPLSATRATGVELIPPDIWRTELSIPLMPRNYVQPKKRKPLHAATATQQKPTVVADWGVIFRVRPDMLQALVSSKVVNQPQPLALQGADATSVVVSSPKETEPGKGVAQPPDASPPHGGTEAAAMVSVDPADLVDEPQTPIAQHDAHTTPTTADTWHSVRNERLARYPTLEERLAELSLGDRGVPVSMVPATTSFAVAPHRESVPSVRLLFDAGVELSPAAKSLYLLENPNYGDGVDRLTVHSTAGSYSLPSSGESASMPRLSLAAMMMMVLAARRFKKRKMQAEAEALRLSTKRAGRAAPSVVSRASRDASPTQQLAQMKQAATERLRGVFRKAAGIASNVAAIARRSQPAAEQPPAIVKDTATPQGATS